MVAILNTQKQRIEETLAKWGTPQEVDQLSLFPPEEARQVAAEKLYQQRRLKEIPKEILTEPVRIRGTYAVKAEPRVEPIGIVYLWPRTR